MTAASPAGQGAEAIAAVVGSGSIGVAFAVLFARAGMTVRMLDVDDDALARAREDVRQRAELVHGLPGGRERTASAIAARISYSTNLAAAAEGAAFVQECAPERLEVKAALFARLAEVAPAAVLASSSSAIVASRIAANLPDAVAERILIGHPGNPPYLLPVIEVVPSPHTAPAAVEFAREFYRSVGLRPVTIRQEIEGFVFNRLQGALLREAYCLVRDGVVDVEDVDEIVRSGLGRRWSIIGPFETVDLNTRGGIASHAEKMGPAYERMGAERGQHDPWTPELVAKVEAQRRAALALEDWDQRVRWRDARLLDLAPLWEQTADAGTTHQNS